MPQDSAPSMSVHRLVDYLDPRPAALALELPIANSVNIPLDELSSRMHELPSRQSPVRVAAPEPYREEAAQFLSIQEREVILAEDWRYGPVEPGRLWSPNDLVLDNPFLERPGRALDLACGTGRDAVLLAGFGWQVTAVDRLPDALDRGRNLAARYLPRELAALIEWVALDIEDPAAVAESDVFKSNYDWISMFWYLNRPLIRLAPELLNPGGGLVLETFTAEHRERFGKPRREAFVLQPGELTTMVPNLEVIRYEETWSHNRHSAKFIAQSPTQ
jgi:SAM-dependent methyltransferase